MPRAFLITNKRYNEEVLPSEDARIASPGWQVGVSEYTVLTTLGSYQQTSQSVTADYSFDRVDDVVRNQEKSPVNDNSSRYTFSPACSPDLSFGFRDDGPSAFRDVSPSSSPAGFSYPGSPNSNYSNPSDGSPASPGGGNMNYSLTISASIKEHGMDHNLNLLVDKALEEMHIGGIHRCPECDKCYSTSSNLARHRQTHRSVTDKKARKCPHCDKVYVSMPAYSMHVRTHNQGCECSFCGKRFSRPWLLQGHVRTHTGEKPFKCETCGKAFADKSNLRAHVQTHSTEKPFVCGRCGKAFALKSYLYKHEESSCMRGRPRASAVRATSA